MTDKVYLDWIESKNHHDLDNKIKQHIARILNYKSGPSFMDLAIQRDQPEMVTYLLDHGFVFSSDSLLLHRCISRNQIEIIQIFIERGHPLENQDSTGTTPLHLAIQEGKLDVVKLLLTGKTNLEIRDYQGYTALYWAYLEEQWEIMKWLLEKGAKCDSKEYLQIQDPELRELISKNEITK